MRVSDPLWFSDGRALGDQPRADQEDQGPQGQGHRPVMPLPEVQGS